MNGQIDVRIGMEGEPNERQGGGKAFNAHTPKRGKKYSIWKKKAKKAKGMPLEDPPVAWVLGSAPCGLLLGVWVQSAMTMNLDFLEIRDSRGGTRTNNQPIDRESRGPLSAFF